MIALGRFCLCLNAADLDATCQFYRYLGFVPVGEDAPGLRASMSNGAHVLTFMSFLEGPVINFRGGHIHNLMRALEQRGLVAEEYNTEPDVLLMRDAHGVPLPANACGHFSVQDPDGREILFNTHPRERQPFAEALQGTPRQDGLVSHPARQGLRQLQIRFDTQTLDTHVDFYTAMGLAVLHASASGKLVTIGHRSCPPASADLSFAFQLRQAMTPAVSLVLQCAPQALAARRQSDSLRLVPHREGLSGMDPDGRHLILQGPA